MKKDDIRKAIEKYQREHFDGTFYDVTAFDKKADIDVITDAINKISKRYIEEQEFVVICEMAKKYLEGAKPLYNTEDEFKKGFQEGYNKAIDDICTTIKNGKIELI